MSFIERFVVRRFQFPTFTTCVESYDHWIVFYVDTLELNSLNEIIIGSNSFIDADLLIVDGLEELSTLVLGDTTSFSNPFYGSCVMIENRDGFSMCYR